MPPESGHRRLPRSSPHEQGVSARHILDFIDAVDRDGPELHSLMVVRHGVVVAEGWWAPYRPDAVHMLFSLTKSFVSTAVGFAQAEGLLSVDDLVLDHLGDLAPEHPDPHLARMRIRHLLTMTAGHDASPRDPVFGTPDWERGFLSLPIEHEPGTHFTYSSAASYMLTAILDRRTGERLLDYLRPRLLDPLGIIGATCEQSPTGVDNGGYGMSVTTEDIACLGQLYLDGGRWEGRQLLPDGWAEEATRSHGPSQPGDGDSAQGYGYQFWRCRHDAFRGDGSFGQFCIVMPREDAVVAITAGTPDLQGVLDRVWAHLLPAMTDDAGSGAAGSARVGLGGVAGAPDPEDRAEAALVERLSGLRLDPPRRPAHVDVPAGWLHGRTITLAPNPAGIVTVTFGPVGPVEQRTPDGFDEPGGPAGSGSPDGTSLITWRVEDRTQTMRLGDGRWEPGVMVAYGSEWQIAAAGAWESANTYVAQIRLLLTPFCLTIRSTFDGDRVRATAQLNVSFTGPTDLGAFAGTLT